MMTVQELMKFGFDEKAIKEWKEYLNTLSEMDREIEDAKLKLDLEYLYSKENEPKENKEYIDDENSICLFSCLLLSVITIAVVFLVLLVCNLF